MFKVKLLMSVDSSILKYLPQRAPFVLVDEILDIGKHHFSTSFMIPSDHCLVKNGTLTEGGIIENMAQTLAAGEGKNAEMNSLTLSGGYLVSVNKLLVLKFPVVNETIVTKVHLIQCILRYRIITATVSIGNEIVATAEMKVIVND